MRGTGSQLPDGRTEGVAERVELRLASLQALLDVSTRISGSLNLEPVLVTVLDTARQLFGADRAAILQREPSGYVCPVLSGLAPAEVEARCRRCTVAPICGQVGATRPLLVAGLSLEPPVVPTDGPTAIAGTRPGLMVPLLRRGEAVGFLVTYHAQPRHFTAEETGVAQALANQAAVAIDNARLYESAERRAKEIAALLEATRQITSSLDLATTLNSILDNIVQLCEADAADVLLLDAGGTILEMEASRGPQAYLSEGFSCRLGEGLPGTAAASGEVVNVPDVDAEPRVVRRDLFWQAGIRSALYAPLRNQGRVIGALGALSRQPAHFSPIRERLLLSLADQAALAIAHARLFAEIGKVEAFRELDRLKSEFIATISHELRTPLTSIKGYAQVLQRRCRQGQPIDPRGLDIINEQSNYMLKLIDDLLTIGRIERGHLTLEPGEVDILALLRETVANVAATAPGHRLVPELPAGSLIVNADVRRLRQVVLNLLSNAVRYSPDGGTITVRTVVGSLELQVSVTDPGIGLAPDQLERVFERFYRGQSDVMHQHPGMGLGLAICRTIVEAHGGRIWAESAGLGLGTTFHFALAAKRRRSTAQEESISADLPESPA